MQRQRPTSAYSYSTACVLPREKEETKIVTETKKEAATAVKVELKKGEGSKKEAATAAKVQSKKDEESMRTSSNISAKRKEELVASCAQTKRDATVIAAALAANLTLEKYEEAEGGDSEDKESASSSSSSHSEKDRDNNNKKDEGEPVKGLTEEDIDFHNPYPKKFPVVEPSLNLQTYQMVRTAVPRTPRPLPPPKPLGRPLVLATHLVPSLPIGLFEVLVEAIEAATGRAVVILYEARTDRPVCTEVADIAILPAGDKWESGNLLPVSFVFEHHLNKTFSPAVYADVVVATDRAPHVETLLDLRGHRCALPDRRRQNGAAALLFNYLHSKGEGPAFFGNTLDANSQVSALQMVAGKQVEVCVLESPVIKFHRQSLPGVYSLHILCSLGPLPPYPIMVNKNLSSEIVGKIKDYLLEIRNDSVWLEKFSPYSVLGFAEYRKSLFDMQESKPVVTSAPYY